MTDKELQHLSRVELIEIIYELQKQNEAAAAQVKRLEKALADREIHISNAGSIAEAAMGLNGVFEAAQAAADQYLLSRNWKPEWIRRKSSGSRSCKGRSAKQPGSSGMRNKRRRLRSPRRIAR